MARALRALAVCIIAGAFAGCITVQLPEPEPDAGKPAPTSAPTSRWPTTPDPAAPGSTPGASAAAEVDPAVPAQSRPSTSEETPAAGAPRDLPAEAATIALSMVGKPYRRAGNTPTGFDCSGLIHFSYGRLAQEVPRDTTGLLGATRAISRQDLRFGDLVFFHIRRQRYSHVGIYVGDGRFVHAPASGGRVRIESLSVAYWSQRFAGARRMLIAAQLL